MSPQEIDLILGQLRDHKEQLDRIEDHARQTNGRVKQLELWRAHIAGVRAALSWVPPLMTGVVSGSVVAVVAWLVARV